MALALELGSTDAQTLIIESGCWCCSRVHIARGVNCVRQLSHIHFKTSLNVGHAAFIFVSGHKGDCQTFRTKPTSAANSMQV